MRERLGNGAAPVGGAVLDPSRRGFEPQRAALECRVSQRLEPLGQAGFDHSQIFRMEPQQLGIVGPGQHGGGALEQLLESRIAESHGRDMLLLGGMREAAEIINNAGKAAEKRIMPELGRIDKALARRIENEMFKFEHLFALDPQAMGALLREVESEVLIDALKGTAEEHREAFFRAMSSRAADRVKDEIASRGRLKMAEVVEAQRTIIAIARRLAGEGVIQFGGGGDDEYV